MIKRTFLALDIPCEIPLQLKKRIDIPLLTNPQIRWERDEKIHVTLKFLGDTNIKIIDALWNSVKSVMQSVLPFHLSIIGFDFFYRNRIPSIFFARIENNEKLNLLVKEINSICNSYGFEEEKKPFHPHLTLLRIKNNSIINELTKIKEIEFERIDFLGNNITFYESQLIQKGSIYLPLYSCNLN